MAARLKNCEINVYLHFFLRLSPAILAVSTPAPDLSFEYRLCSLDAGWYTNLPRFQEARAEHVRVESSSRCFLSEVCSPQGIFELTNGKCHVLPQSKNVFELGGLFIYLIIQLASPNKLVLPITCVSFIYLQQHCYLRSRWVRSPESVLH